VHLINLDVSNQLRLSNKDELIKREELTYEKFNLTRIIICLINWSVKSDATYSNFLDLNS